MSVPAERIDPADIRGINERLRAWNGAEQPLVPVTIDRIIVDGDALPAIVETAEDLCGDGAVLLVCDLTPIRRRGADFKETVVEQFEHVLDTGVCEVPSGDSTLETAGAVAVEVARHAVVVSVGSGSVTDVAKYARHLATEQTGRTVPLVSVPTAASVTAYTSALAVLSIGGVKRTLPAKAPDAVICDLPTICEAPRAMTRAGFGDVLARGVSYGDWYLARQLGMGDVFSELPGRLVQHAEQAVIESAGQIGAGEIDGVRELMTALMLDGMAMSVVNETAPLSGWEHAISHYLDLTAAGDGREIGLHGAQVGVATLVAARGYEQCWAQLDPGGLLRDMEATTCRKTLEQHFARYDRSGQLLDELWRDVQKKIARWQQAAPARQRFVDRLLRREFDSFIRTHVLGSDVIADALQRAGAPLGFGELNPAISQATALEALHHSHLIRARFTFGDLLACGGCFTAGTAARLLGPP